ncbi:MULTISPECIES: hypothetical protein [Olivibacter]|jgi:hypothetical protein|uniref:Universal stress protein n=3 Tax=Sphingobacteriaceae TaxID=84566 RepID=F4C4F6_SPHS2|nr:MULTISPECIES: hypothetical protein [Olivibacter]MDM8175706.1 hypothetical protein [Olivibacter sp. 47]MDX3914314.1 hypothetical protein [Pseudosphingobacterium sp.]QEL02442.1 hypothetical protein FKG96_17020 [Olivibacter sp. LS-1]
MKKILIPTDFSGQSLDILTDYLLSCNEKEVSVLFFSVVKLSDSITDLLLLSKRTKEIELIPRSFENYCRCIQDEFERIKDVRFEYFYGNTIALFRNFLDANRIDEIVYDPSIELQMITKESSDPIDLIERCKWNKWVPSRKQMGSKLTEEEKAIYARELERALL